MIFESTIHQAFWNKKIIILIPSIANLKNIPLQVSKCTPKDTCTTGWEAMY